MCRPIIWPLLIHMVRSPLERYSSREENNWSEPYEGIYEQLRAFTREVLSDFQGHDQIKVSV